MCKCLFVEFKCSCTTSDCPHRDPRSKQYHAANALFQIDHFKWQHCADFLGPAGLSSQGRSSSSSSRRRRRNHHATTRSQDSTATRESSKKPGTNALKRLFTSAGRGSGRGSASGGRARQPDRDRGAANYKVIDGNGDSVSAWSSSSTDSWSSGGSVVVAAVGEQEQEQEQEQQQEEEEKEEGEGQEGQAARDSQQSQSQSQSQSQQSQQPSAQVPPMRRSRDPRHGGGVPECEGIVHEGWCITTRRCRWCEEYWMGRVGVL